MTAATFNETQSAVKETAVTCAKWRRNARPDLVDRKSISRDEGDLKMLQGFFLERRRTRDAIENALRHQRYYSRQCRAMDNGRSRRDHPSLGMTRNAFNDFHDARSGRKERELDPSLIVVRLTMTDESSSIRSTFARSCVKISPQILVLSARWEKASEEEKQSEMREAEKYEDNDKKQAKSANEVRPIPSSVNDSNALLSL